MSQYPNTIEEVRELCHEFLEQSITEVQLQRLDVLIKDDVEARVEFVELMNMHNTLATYLADTLPVDSVFEDTIDLESIVDLDRDVSKPEGEPEAPQSPLLFNILESIPGYFSQNTLQILVLLLLLVPPMIALFTVFNGSKHGALPSPDSVAVNRPQNVLPGKHLGVIQEYESTIKPETFRVPEKVARIVRAVSADWGDVASDRFKTDSYLVRGQKYSLCSGFVELQFRHDARVVVRAPATFAPTAHGVLRFDTGECVAHVPPKAAGFMIESNGSQIIDLGTEFGVKADPNMETDVYVFKGKVEMAIKGQPPENRVELTASESATASAATGVIAAKEVVPDRFVRKLDLPGVITKLPMKKADFNLWTQKRVLGNVGITNGDETCTFTLRRGVQQNTSEWIFRPLGVIQPMDVGQTLRFSVDCTLKTPKVQPTVKLTAGFSTTVSRERCDTFLGNPHRVPGSQITKNLQSLNATLLITDDMVGRKLFLVLCVEDDSPGSGKDQYEFSDLRVDF